MDPIIKTARRRANNDFKRVGDLSELGLVKHYLENGSDLAGTAPLPAMRAHACARATAGLGESGAQKEAPSRDGIFVGARKWTIARVPRIYRPDAAKCATGLRKETIGETLRARVGKMNANVTADKACPSPV